jgi:hypothetical protein
MKFNSIQFTLQLWLIFDYTDNIMFGESNSSLE